MKSSDISKGKRSGYRIITYVVDKSKKIRLLTIIVLTRQLGNYLKGLLLLNRNLVMKLDRKLKIVFCPSFRVCRDLTIKLGEIENLPVADNTVDIIISNL